MKKIVALLMVLVLAFAMASCTPETPEAPEFDPSVKSEGVMTHAEFMAAEKNDSVVIEAFVQAKQGWWEEEGVGKATIYLQDTVGGYLAYNLPCTEAEYNRMTVGTRLKITGYKDIWSGEHEVVDATYEILDGTYVAEATDVTALLGTDGLAEKNNMFVSFKGLTVYSTAIYKWNGTGSRGDDLYFNAGIDGKVYTFVVESYLTGKDTAVYQAVEALKVGDVVNMDGFLYWYEGPQAHITAVTTTFEASVKSEGVMTHAEFMAAAKDDEVVIEAYVQAKQGWWEDEGVGQATIYLQDTVGGYLAYNLPCTEAEYNRMTVGTRLKITGYKDIWSGEHEVVDATYEILDGKYVAAALDATALLGTDELAEKNNMFVSFKGLTVYSTAIYKWNGTGTEGDDLYFGVELNGNTYTFVVESYLCGADTEVYKAVKALAVGDVIDLEGFLYWYEGPQAHVTVVVKK